MVHSVSGTTSLGSRIQPVFRGVSQTSNRISLPHHSKLATKQSPNGSIPVPDANKTRLAGKTWFLIEETYDYSQGKGGHQYTSVVA